MIKHTPGPWSKIQGIDHTAASIKTESGISVGTAFGSEFDQTKANASLIAAAPELLATLQAVVEAIENSKAGWNGLSIWQEDVHAVIAKATGESK